MNFLIIFIISHFDYTCLFHMDYPEAMIVHLLIRHKFSLCQWGFKQSQHLYFFHQVFDIIDLKLSLAYDTVFLEKGVGFFPFSLHSNY